MSGDNPPPEHLMGTFTTMFYQPVLLYEIFMHACGVGKLTAINYVDSVQHKTSWLATREHVQGTREHRALGVNSTHT